VKVAATEQLATIGFVVNVVPTSVPPHVPPTEAVNPVFGETVKAVVPPWPTFCGALGAMVPLGPAPGVTV